MENVYRSFYTKNNYITKYMVSMINPRIGEKILEPCGGDGVFIDTMLEINPDLHIDTCDLNDEAVQTLRNKYLNKPNIKVWKTDTLMDESFDQYAKAGGYYDKIVGNPPYGGWQEYNHRTELRQKYNGFYVKETYSLFLLRCISMLNEDGVLSFIIPDTFLYLHNHTALRKFLLENTIIKEILIFPSKFFPGVSFGYSSLSIITAQRTRKTANALNNEIEIIKGLKKDKDIQRIGLGEDTRDLIHIKLKQADVLDDTHHVFYLNDGHLSDVISNVKTTVGDFAECVTGIYTGDNKSYMAVTSPNVKNCKGYPVVGDDDIEHGWENLTGLNNGKRYIPIVKGSSPTKYVRKSNDWVIDWSENAITHYNTDKKARFQNSSYYFRPGIALPMVKSSKINAVWMQGMVFDQSIVGVFPKDKKYNNFLLGFLNSDIANKLIHLINPTANNSANYIKKLPIIEPSDNDLAFIDGLVNSIIENESTGEEQEQINHYFNNLFGVN